MHLKDLLNSLSSEERDFIAKLDYGDRFEKHRSELDAVIQSEGIVDFDQQIWFPYEVIELGKNVLVAGHEKEFAACIVIILKNISLGKDPYNEVDDIWSRYEKYKQDIPPEWRELIDDLISKCIENLR